MPSGRTAVQNKDVLELENAVALLREFKAAAETTPPGSPDEAVALLQMVRDRVDAPIEEEQPVL
jgi:hypothetical protein